MRQMLVTAAIIQQGDRILLAGRRPGSHLAGHWEFPGGRVEPGEAPEAAIAREIQEELGCRVAVEGLYDLESHLYQDEQKQVILLFYRCRLVAEVPSPREGQAIAWVRPDELSRYPLAPADQRVARRLAAEAAAGASNGLAAEAAPGLAAEAAPGPATVAAGPAPTAEATAPPPQAAAGAVPDAAARLLDRVVLVLYQPQDVVNVAAVVRVMSNFGLRRLRLVEPAAFDPYRIEGIAHHTGEIVRGVERFPDLSAALADCTFVLGTTGRAREVRRERLTPRQAAGLVLRAAALSVAAPAPGVSPEPPSGLPPAQASAPGEGLVAILFGREKDGLPNAALEDCHGLVTIPTAPGNRSLNLAQSAVVLAYELWLAAAAGATQEATQDAAQDATQESLPTAAGAAPEPPPAAPRPSDPGAPPLGDDPRSVALALAEDARLATGRQREEMFQALADLLWALYPATTDTRVSRSLARLRAVLLRAAPRADEATMLAHLFQHLARAIRRQPGAG